MAVTERLDQLLVQRGFFDTREKAKRALMAGVVYVEGRAKPKPGDRVPTEIFIRVEAQERYVGRGGIKLEGALREFGISTEGKVCLDVGASTGGFTDCLLQHGASRVYALDVGHGQMAWKIRSDPRVVVMEKFNARNLQPDDLPEAIDLAVADVSFISLTLILPPIFRVLKGEAVVLIKPQFELGPERVGRGGIVREDADRQDAIAKIREFVESSGVANWSGVVPSDITGMDGNQEYLAWIQKSSA